MTDLSVISIGTLAANPLWGEKQPARTGHATTTLVRTGDAAILIDPGLPPQALVARLAERVNLLPSDITHVFLTSFQPDCRRALPAFDSAEWLISETEREAVGVPMARTLAGLTQLAQQAQAAGAELPEDQLALLTMLSQDTAVLQRCRPAPDKLAPGVDLFPLPGVTPGLCGLLVSIPTQTILVCGDAIATADHLAQGKVLPNAADREQALDSFREAVEIADTLVLGRDNAVPNPAAGAF